MFTRTNLCQMILATSIRSGSWTLMPTTAALPPHIDQADFAARALMLCESQRLQEARSYSIGEDTTALAVATTATSAPGEQITTRRAPSPSGLMIFKDPIGSDTATWTTNRGQEVEIHTPIVAASWSLWNGDQSSLDGVPLTWIRNSATHGFLPLAPKERGIWMTFYAPRTGDTDVDPDAPVAVDPWGEAVTARQSTKADHAFQHRNPDLWGPMAWHNEFFLPDGEKFNAHPAPGSVQHWAATVYTTWQIMQQTGRQQLVETTEHTLPPAARKKAKAKAKRLGHKTVGDGVVRVIDLAAPIRPAKQAADGDAAASDGRRTVQWSCRWPVPPYRRNTCTNPHLHHRLDDDDLKHHEHREDVIPFKIKGPADKPLRVKGGTTFVFNHDPEQ
ncbi:hypothetical protein [Streptomyces sp. NBC_01750]|uniref:hypothetical protein n=1 Tax=Streptomyces sp. NBC_01750 TaxID=2975928 RepID=UPI002DDA781A|nr:hypothetical protein [Streptomyces sp. NBC_01750]WSD37508.1 hypothetical protein OG966_39860 [Streptomyces sp. NBC_01750]